MLLLFVKEYNIEVESAIRPILYSSRPIRWQIFCTLAIILVIAILLVITIIIDFVNIISFLITLPKAVLAIFQNYYI